MTLTLTPTLEGTRDPGHPNLNHTWYGLVGGRLVPIRLQFFLDLIWMSICYLKNDKARALITANYQLLASDWFVENVFMMRSLTCYRPTTRLLIS